jgi:hypothetical protein
MTFSCQRQFTLGGERSDAGILAYMASVMPTVDTVMLATTGGQLIDGGAPGTLTAGQSIKVQSTGAGWITIP